MSEINIKNLIIGDIETENIIGEFSLSSSQESNKEINALFSKMLKKKENLNIGGRNKIYSKGECYYYTVISPSYLYLILVLENYPERIVYKLIDTISEEKIPLMVNEKTNKLNSQGKQSLNKLINEYQNYKKIDKVSEIQNDVNEIKNEVKENIKNMVNNVEDVKQLEIKSDNLKNDASQFKKNSESLKKETFWMNCKFWIIIFGIILILVAVLLLILTTDVLI
jgi:hypothetical protein